MVKGDRNLVEWLDKLIEDKFRKSGFRVMTDEEWEEYKAKRQQGSVTGTIIFLKGESAKKAAALFKKKEE